MIKQLVSVAILTSMTFFSSLAVGYGGGSGGGRSGGLQQGHKDRPKPLYHPEPKHYPTQTFYPAGKQYSTHKSQPVESQPVEKQTK